MADIPWTITYADGAANVYRFSQAAGDVVEIEYDPVRPEDSSTGTYSGGDPYAGRLPATDARIAELWQRVERLAADTASHQDDRNKGTGAFAVVTPAGTRRFIVQMGPLVTDFDRFAAGFR